MSSMMPLRSTFSKLRRHCDYGLSFTRALVSESGNNAVETALVLPVALLVFTGLLSFGVYLNKSLELANSTSLSGQYLALNRGVSDPCAMTVSAFEGTAPYLQPSSLSFSFVVNGVSFPNTTSCSGNAANTAKGDTVQIKVTYPCTFVIFLSNAAPGCPLTSQVTEIIQ